MFARAASFRTKVLDKNNTEKVSFAVRGFIENFSLQFNNLFYNEVNRVVLPNAYLSATTDQIYVSFERGSKTLNTSLQNVNPKSTGIDINESMVIVSTMTPINDSQTDISYQSKPAKLIVRLKKEGKGSSVVGVANIDLANFASAYAGTDLSLELEQSTVLGALLEATIVPTLLSAADNTADMDHSSHVSSNESMLRKAKSLQGLGGDSVDSGNTSCVRPSLPSAGPDRVDRGKILSKSRSKSMYLPQSSFEVLQHNTAHNGKSTMQTEFASGLRGDMNTYEEYSGVTDQSAEVVSPSREMVRARSVSVRFASSQSDSERDSERSKGQRSQGAHFGVDATGNECGRFASRALPTSVNIIDSVTPLTGKMRRASIQHGMDTVKGQFDCPREIVKERRRSVSIAASLFTPTPAKKEEMLKTPFDGTAVADHSDEDEQILDEVILPVDYDTIEEEGLGGTFGDYTQSILEHIRMCIWDIKSAQDRLMGSVDHLRYDEKLNGFVRGLLDETAATRSFLDSIDGRLDNLESSIKGFISRLDVVLLDKKDLESELDHMHLEQHRITETELHAEKMKLTRETERQAAAIANLTATLEASRQEVATLTDKLREVEELEASHSLETYYLNQGRVDLENKYEKLKKKYAKVDRTGGYDDGQGARSPSIDFTQSNSALIQASNLAEMHEREMERVYRKCSELKTKFIMYRAKVDVRRVVHSNALLMEQMTRMNLENDVSHANKAIAMLRKQISQLEESKKHAQSQVTAIANIDEMDRDDLVTELINAKVQVASLALENEEERKRSQTLTAKLKMYSKRVSNLEEELDNMEQNKL